MKYSLTFLYDGACPLCLREINFLKDKDKCQNISFVDISDKNYNSSKFNNISYETAMTNLHGILDNGQIIKGIDVLVYAYELVGLGWIYSPIKIPLISKLIKVAYKFWAKYRLKLTGRGKEQISCDINCEV